MKDIYWKIDQVLDSWGPTPPNFRDTVDLLKQLFRMTDADGIRPEIFLALSNRGGGKTYPVAYLLLRLMIDYGVKIGLQTQWGGDIGNMACEIFNKTLTNEDCFAGYEIYEEITLKNVYSTIRLKHKETHTDIDGNEVVEDIDEVVGYGFAINSDTKIKKASPLLSDIEIILQDEFQSNKYVPNEVDKFVNVHFSLNRGGDEGVRCLPVIMLSNSLDICNPYFEMWRITDKIKSDTKFYRGHGLCLLRFINEKVAAAQQANRFNVACAASRMMASNIGNEWLNNSWACIGKPEGRGVYMCSIDLNGKKYGIRKYGDIWAINRSVDKTDLHVYNMSNAPIPDLPSFCDSAFAIPLRKAWRNGKVLFSDIGVKTDVSRWI